MMTGVAHRAAVLKILDRLPGAKTKGFFADLRAALREDGDPEWDTSDDVRVVPDAFLINGREKSVIAFEVEASNPVNREKISNYCELFWALDDWEWRLGLITIDRWGAVTSLVDMRAAALEQVELEALRSKDIPTEQEITERRFFMERFRELNPHLYDARPPKAQEQLSWPSQRKISTEAQTAIVGSLFATPTRGAPS
jgi:hypothetical protein